MLLDIAEFQVTNKKMIWNGKRANQARKLVKELIEEGGEDSDKNNSSDVSPKQQTEDEIIPVCQYCSFCL